MGATFPGQQESHHKRTRKEPPPAHITTSSSARGPTTAPSLYRWDAQTRVPSAQEGAPKRAPCSALGLKNQPFRDPPPRWLISDAGRSRKGAPKTAPFPDLGLNKQPFRERARKAAPFLRQITFFTKNSRPHRKNQIFGSPYLGVAVELGDRRPRDTICSPVEHPISAGTAKFGHSFPHFPRFQIGRRFGSDLSEKRHRFPRLRFSPPRTPARAPLCPLVPPMGPYVPNAAAAPRNGITVPTDRAAQTSIGDLRPTFGLGPITSD